MLPFYGSFTSIPRITPIIDPRPSADWLATEACKFRSSPRWHQKSNQTPQARLQVEWSPDRVNVAILLLFYNHPTDHVHQSPRWHQETNQTPQARLQDEWSPDRINVVVLFMFYARLQDEWSPDRVNVAVVLLFYNHPTDHAYHWPPVDWWLEPGSTDDIKTCSVSNRKTTCCMFSVG